MIKSQMSIQRRGVHEGEECEWKGLIQKVGSIRTKKGEDSSAMVTPLGSSQRE